MSSEDSTNGPVRTCIGCRSDRPQAELVRLYLDADARVRIGRTGPGRGAWLCSDTDDRCVQAAVERKALARAFRRKPESSSVASLVDSWGNRR